MFKYSKIGKNLTSKPIVKISPSMPPDPVKPTNGAEGDKPHPAVPASPRK